ncbi:MAG TPA: zinc-ribbon domain-containing protein [Firmicutes bacterium]|nr:zinc-ribbon domain-containing protein [Bacillota bacterium]
MGLWNQVKQQASSLGAKAAEKTQELRLQSEINDLKNQIGKKQSALGVLVYQMYKENRGDYESLLPICHEIDALQQQIVEIEHKIAELKIKPGTCPQCNHENIPDARFCAKCGVPLQQDKDTTELPAEEPKTKPCPECNTEQLEGAKFCAQCGCKLE